MLSKTSHYPPTKTCNRPSKNNSLVGLVTIGCFIIVFSSFKSKVHTRGLSIRVTRLLNRDLVIIFSSELNARYIVRYYSRQPTNQPIYLYFVEYFYGIQVVDGSREGGISLCPWRISQPYFFLLVVFICFIIPSFRVVFTPSSMRENNRRAS